MRSKTYLLPLLLTVFLLTTCDKPQNAISPDAVPEIPAQTDKKAAAANDLKHLKKWIGKYPVNPQDKEFQNFFQVPEVRKILLEILKEDGFRKLLAHFAGNDLIKEKDGFLVMLGTTAKNAAQDVDYALLALNPDTGETHVFFADNKKLSSFSNTKDGGNVTAAIKQEILIYTDSAQSALIGALKQKPAEGFACYAVLPKDWDGEAAKRSYIFVSTDNGGVFNLEGRDIELKQGDSQETKGENGKTYAEWNFSDKNTKAKFDLAVEKTLNDGADAVYEGTLTVTSGAKTQTIQIKAFCGG